MDKIILRGLACRASIGVTEAERKVGQNLTFDVDLFLDLAAAGHSDRLDDTVSYADVAELIVTVARETEYKLLERLAEQIAGAILERFPIERVRLRVLKVPPPADVAMHAAGVEIERIARMRRGE